MKGEGFRSVFAYLAPTELAAGKLVLGATPFPKYRDCPQGSRFQDSAKGWGEGFSGSLRMKRWCLLGCTQPGFGDAEQLPQPRSQSYVWSGPDADRHPSGSE